MEHLVWERPVWVVSSFGGPSDGRAGGLQVLFRQHPSWPVIDVTRRAVEETAAIIVRIMSERGMGSDVGEVGQL